MSTKTCICCGRVLDEDKYFYSDGKGGKENKCKDCKHEYYIANQETRKAYQRMYESEHREQKKVYRNKRRNRKMIKENIEMNKVEINLHKRNMNTKDVVRKLAGYKCEIDNKHSYVTKDNGEEFTHVHHIIPLKYQNMFNVNLDQAENMINLCVVCHTKIHNGNISDKIELLGIMFNQRKYALNRIGINVSFEDLLKFYNII